MKKTLLLKKLKTYLQLHKIKTNYGTFNLKNLTYLKKKFFRRKDIKFQQPLKQTFHIF